MNASQDFSHYLIPRFTSFRYVPELIASDVKFAVNNGRTSLVLSERIERLNILYDVLKDSAQNVIFITGKGSMREKDLITRESTRFLFLCVANGKPFAYQEFYCARV